MSVRNRISLVFTSDRPLTTDEQEAMLVQFELAVTEPQTVIRMDDGTVGDYDAASWSLVGEFDLEAVFPVIGG